MACKPPGYTEDEIPTQRTSGRPRQHPDSDHTLGQLMVESLNHRRRIEVLEDRLEVLETAKTDTSIAPNSSNSTPPGRQRIFALIRKTITYTVVGIAAIISAIKELGLLK